MATVKKNNKKKIVVPICLVLVVALILVAISAKNYAAYGQFRLKTDGEEVTLSTISTQNIIESVSCNSDEDYRRRYKGIQSSWPLQR